MSIFLNVAIGKKEINLKLPVEKIPSQTAELEVNRIERDMDVRCG
jgi:hypothetical protein